ncbi:MAG: lysozyme inhibitor LprI family protein [Pseudoruegeria sp.]
MKFYLILMLFVPSVSLADSEIIPPKIAAQMNTMLEACWRDKSCETSEVLSFCGDSIDAGGAPLEWVKCQNEILTWWDAKLNEVYKEKIALQKTYDVDRSDGYYEDLLRNMQRVWVPFRDAACNYLAHGQPSGSGATNDEIDCKILKTTEQIYFIQNPLG